MLAQTNSFADRKSHKSIAQRNDRSQVIPDPSGKEYFPKGNASYYTQYLSAMKEPSVKADLENGVERVIRFTYLRSFHDPLAVRITDIGGKLTVRAVRLKKDLEHRPVKVDHDKSWDLDGNSTKVILALFEQKDFWKPLNSIEKARGNGKDGSNWIFEIHDKEGYRMIDIRNPGVVSPDLDPTKMRDLMLYKKTGEAILDIGKILPEPYDRY